MSGVACAWDFSAGALVAMEGTAELNARFSHIGWAYAHFKAGSDRYGC
jgi:hypothetical protein